MRKFISLLLSMSLIMTVAAVSGATTTVSAATDEKTLYSFEGSVDDGVTIENCNHSVSADYKQTGSYSLKFTPKPTVWDQTGKNVTSSNFKNYIEFNIPTGLNITGDVGFYVTCIRPDAAASDNSNFEAYGVQMADGTKYFTKYGHFAKTSVWTRYTVTNTTLYNYDNTSNSRIITSENFSDSAPDDKRVDKIIYVDGGTNDEKYASFIDNIFYQTDSSATTTTTTKATTTTTTAAPETTTPSSSSFTKTKILDWDVSSSDYSYYKEGATLSPGTDCITAVKDTLSKLITVSKIILSGYDGIYFTVTKNNGDTKTAVKLTFDDNSTYSPSVTLDSGTTECYISFADIGYAPSSTSKILIQATPDGAANLTFSDIYGYTGTPPTTTTPTVTMEKGAAMRIDGLTYGIRFSATVPTADLTAFKAADNTINDFGMLIAPAASNLTTANMIVEKSQELQEEGTLASDKNSVVAKYNGLKPMADATSGLTQIVGSLIKIDPSNANKQYVARAYVEYTDKTRTTQYLYSDISDARSLAWVAHTIRAEGEANPNDKTIYYNQLCYKHKLVVNKWADKYNQSETTTTAGTTQQMSTFNPGTGDVGSVIFDWDLNQQRAVDTSLERVWKEGTTQTDLIQDYAYFRNTAALTANKVYDVVNWWQNNLSGYRTFTFYAQGSGQLRIQFDGETDPSTGYSYVTTPITLTNELKLYTVTIDDCITINTTTLHHPTFQLIPTENLEVGELQLYISDFYGLKSSQS